MADLSDERLAELICETAKWVVRGYADEDVLPALRELQRLREQVRWRPMEEAPKDGAKILVRSPTNNVYVVMRDFPEGGPLPTGEGK